MRRFQFSGLQKVNGVLHTVTMRDPEAVLEGSMALHTGQDAEAVFRNRQSLGKYFGSDALFVSALQVHGDEVYRIKNPQSRGWESLDRRLQADALVTATPKVVLTILTADCVPILLCDPEARVIAAVHAGWKGSRLGVVAKTVRTMCQEFGAEASRILAAIGPAIGGCCYEVGEEVAGAFRSIEGAVTQREGARPRLDLKAVNRFQLLEAGLLPERIEVASYCTACEKERFFSYRAEGGCDGRFLSAIMLKS